MQTKQQKQKKKQSYSLKIYIFIPILIITILYVLGLFISVDANQKDEFFSHLQLAPADPILGTALAYKADPSPIKLNLGIGAYRDESEKPYVFHIVRKVEKIIFSDQTLDKVIFS